jgi:predicted ester cyclase
LTEPLDAAPERLTYDGARALFERNYQLLNEHDVRHIPTVFTEDIEFEDDAWPESIRGHAQMQRFMTAPWRAMPDFRFELVEGPYLAEDGRHAAARVRVSGTATGRFDPPGFAPTGARVTTEFGGFYEFEGERVRRARVIVNMNDVGIQIGAAPAPGSRGERLALAMQRLNARRVRRRAKA